VRQATEIVLFDVHGQLLPKIPTGRSQPGVMCAIATTRAPFRLCRSRPCYHS
jgi:hypothetical protein